jgi:hypothetical protein
VGTIKAPPATPKASHTPPTLGNLGTRDTDGAKATLQSERTFAALISIRLLAARDDPRDP